MRFFKPLCKQLEKIQISLYLFWVPRDLLFERMRFVNKGKY